MPSGKMRLRLWSCTITRPGIPAPSEADIALTVELDQAGKLLGIDVLDHLIVGSNGHTSLRRLGLGFPRNPN